VRACVRACVRSFAWLLLAFRMLPVVVVMSVVRVDFPHVDLAFRVLATMFVHLSSLSALSLSLSLSLSVALRCSLSPLLKAKTHKRSVTTLASRRISPETSSSRWSSKRPGSQSNHKSASEIIIMFALGLPPSSTASELASPLFKTLLSCFGLVG
jgi:hypothetical protein